MNESLKGLEQHEGESLLTEIPFLGELSLEELIHESHLFMNRTRLVSGCLCWNQKEATHKNH